MKKELWIKLTVEEVAEQLNIGRIDAAKLLEYVGLTFRLYNYHGLMADLAAIFNIIKPGE